MKRKIVCLLAICFTIFLGASYMEEIMNNQTGDVFDVDTEPFLYEGTKNTDVIAVDEAGYLYATTCITELDNGIITNESDYVYEPFQHIVKIYDLDGDCVKKVKLRAGNGKFSFLVAKDNLLYGVAKKFIKEEYIPTLYRIDVITLYKEKTIKIPKIHVDMDILPHFYFVVQIGSKIKEAKMFCNVIGITLDGTYHKNSEQLDLKGIISPAYSINSFLGKIPLVGSVLAGKDGTVIAANYSINGSLSDPEIKINPLSVFSPNSLKDLFASAFGENND